MTLFASFFCVAVAFVIVMAEHRPAKLRKLEGLRRRLPQVTQTALAAILKDVGEHGMPDLTTRQNMTEARKELANSNTLYGPLIQTMDVQLISGHTYPMLIAHPWALLWYLFDQCASWRDLVVARHRENPSSVEKPWGLVLYTDEVTPGNALSPDLTRKSQACYMSFLELGHAALARESAWLCLLVHRSNQVRHVFGKMAQVIGALLKIMFPVDGGNLHTTGIQMSSESGESLRLHIKLKTMVQDGAAHKEIWQIKGDSGMRMCVGCDIINSNSDLLQYAAAGDLKQNVIKVCDLEFTTDAEARSAANRLKSYHDANVQGFERLSMVIGFTYCSYMLLNDAALVDVVFPVSQFMHDWMHGLFASGVFNLTLHLLLETLEGAGRMHDVYDRLFDYVGSWHLPRRLSNVSNLQEIFNNKRRSGNKKGGSFRAAASEGLSIVPILAFWLRAIVLPVVDDAAKPACEAFLAFAGVAECFYSVARGVVKPKQLRKAVEAFLAAFVAAFGDEWFTPKMHWLLHYARELGIHKTLLACFVHERKHKCIRRYACPTVNTRSFERTVLEEITCQQLWDLNAPGTFKFDIGLVGPRTPSRKEQYELSELLGLGPGIVDATASVSRFSEFETCEKKDIVLIDIDGSLVAGEIWLHARLQGVEASLVSLWALRHFHRDSQSAEWIIDDTTTVLETHWVVATVTWYPLGGGIVRTLIPSDLLRYF